MDSQGRPWGGAATPGSPTPGAPIQVRKWQPTDVKIGRYAAVSQLRAGPGLGKQSHMQLSVAHTHAHIPLVQSGPMYRSNSL